MSKTPFLLLYRPSWALVIAESTPRPVLLDAPENPAQEEMAVVASIRLNCMQNEESGGFGDKDAVGDEAYCRTPPEL